ncbi:thiamine phosphate synthase [Pseudochelatococcus sp. B33]
MRRPPQPPLLVVSDRKQLAGGAAALGALADAAFAAGCRWISLREKDLAPDAQAALARDLVERAAAFAAYVTVHGSPEIALHAGAHGVHLPEKADAAAARRLLGPDALIGQSVHAPEQARAVDPTLIDYVIAGPVQATASKPGYGPALGAAGFAAIVKESPVPVVAIGGIEAQTVASCLAAGAAGVAVMGTVMRAARPQAVIAALLERLPG